MGEGGNRATCDLRPVGYGEAVYLKVARDFSALRASTISLLEVARDFEIWGGACGMVTVTHIMNAGSLKLIYNYVKYVRDQTNNG